MNIQIGQQAPDFTLPDQDGKTHKLSDYLGKWVVLYFYPEDNTSGCTTEACSMRDHFPVFGNLQAVVLGVSPDSVASHKHFVQQYNLPFTLLSDEQKQVLQQYGVWQDRVLRTTFLINPQGQIAKIYEQVKPEVHAQEVLADLQSMAGK